MWTEWLFQAEQGGSRLPDYMAPPVWNIQSFDTSVIGATGSNSNQVIDFIKEIDANPDRVYYICYLIINTLRVASLKALRECAIEKAVQFS